MYIVLQQNKWFALKHFRTSGRTL